MPLCMKGYLGSVHQCWRNDYGILRGIYSSSSQSQGLPNSLCHCIAETPRVREGIGLLSMVPQQSLTGYRDMSHFLAQLRAAVGYLQDMIQLLNRIACLQNIPPLRVVKSRSRDPGLEFLPSTSIKVPGYPNAKAPQKSIVPRVQGLKFGVFVRLATATFADEQKKTGLEDRPMLCVGVRSALWGYPTILDFGHLIDHHLWRPQTRVARIVLPLPLVGIFTQPTCHI